MRRQGGLCLYCDKPLTPEQATIDHVKPKSKEGSKKFKNLAAACSPCNLAKANFSTEMEVVEYARKVIAILKRADAFLKNVV